MYRPLISIMKRGAGGSSGLNLPTVFAASTTGSSSGTLALPMPPFIADNDIAIIFTETASGEPVTAPSGWTDMGVPTGNGISQLGVLWKRILASEGTVTIPDSGNHTHGVMMIVRGCIPTGSPWHVHQSNTNILNGGNASLVDHITGLTTTINNCLFVGGATGNSGSVVNFFDNWAASGLASVTEKFDYITTGPVRHIGVVTGTKITAGASGNIQYQSANSNNFGGQFLGALMGP